MRKGMSCAEAAKLGLAKSIEAMAKMKQERINLYNINPKKCIRCSNIISYEKRKNKFCSQTCSAICNNENRIPIKRFCLNCEKELLYKERVKNKKFCNFKCNSEYKYKILVAAWLERGIVDLGKWGIIPKFIRKYLFEKYDSKCQKCGWNEKNPFTGKIPLEVHHVDGNWQNCKEENLELLCPNHHSLTRNKALNKGKGRPKQTIYRAK